MRKLTVALAVVAAVLVAWKGLGVLRHAIDLWVWRDLARMQIDTLAAKVPDADPREWIHTGDRAFDTLEELRELAAAPFPDGPDPRDPAPADATRLAAALAWIRAAEAERDALESPFRGAVQEVAGPTFTAAPASGSATETKKRVGRLPVLIWDVAASRGHRAQYVLVPAARRARDPAAPYVLVLYRRSEISVGTYRVVRGFDISTARMGGDALQVEGDLSLIEMPARRDLGGARVKGGAPPEFVPGGGGSQRGSEPDLDPALRTLLEIGFR